jgi:hypothetical protein
MKRSCGPPRAGLASLAGIAAGLFALSSLPGCEGDGLTIVPPLPFDGSTRASPT